MASGLVSQEGGVFIMLAPPTAQGVNPPHTRLKPVQDFIAAQRDEIRRRGEHQPVRMVRPLRPHDPPLRLPVLGFGTWATTTNARETGATRHAVTHALLAGYRHIDCASYYGNQREVGEALAEVSRRLDLPRTDVFLTGKLWNTDHHRVRDACRDTLEELGVTYLDLYLIHWPCTQGSTVTIAQTWAAMAALVDEGLVRAIGCSNFSIKKLLPLMSCAYPPQVVQAESHPWFRNDLLREWCQDHGIHFSA